MSEETTDTQATAEEEAIVEEAVPATEPAAESEVEAEEAGDTEAVTDEEAAETKAEGEAEQATAENLEAEAAEAETGEEAEEPDPEQDQESPTAEAAAEAEDEAKDEPEGLAEPESIEDLEKKMRVKGTVERLELYGAFIDIGIDTPALIHISKLGKKNRVNRVSDALNVGDEVEVWVEKVDPEQNQVMVSMREPLAVEWSDLKARQVYTGTVTRLENFGAFVDIGAEREGLVHISEMSHDYVKHPSEVVSVDGEVEVQVLGFNRRKRRIDLSMKALQDAPRDAEVASAEDVRAMEEDSEELPTAMEIAMRRAMQKEEGEGGQKKRNKQQKKKGQDDILSRTLKLRE